MFTELQSTNTLYQLHLLIYCTLASSFPTPPPRAAPLVPFPSLYYTFTFHSLRESRCRGRVNDRNLLPEFKRQYLGCIRKSTLKCKVTSSSIYLRDLRSLRPSIGENEELIQAQNSYQKHQSSHQIQQS